MNPYIGDRQLEPDEQEEPCAKCGNRHCDRLCDDPDEPNNICEYCDGSGSTNPTWSDPLGDQCPECLGTGIADSLEHLSDPGEPNDYPDDQL